MLKNKFFNYQGLMIVALVIFSSIVLFFNLGQRSLWEPDEGRYAEISREMVESGDWLTPRLNYIKHFDKPVITYWTIASSFKLFGQNEFTAHLPLVLIGLLGVLATFFLGKELFDARTGFLSAIVLISSLGYPVISRIVSTDIIFSFFCLLSYLFFVRKNYILFYISLALAVMTKGPVLFIIVLIPLCAFLIYQRAWSTFKQIPWVKGTFLFILIATPWYIYQILNNAGLFNDWFVQHTVNRVIRDIKDPVYFFLPVLIGLFFPWIFFLVSALKRNLSFKRTSLNEESAKLLLLFLWFALPFIFFSCIGKKLVPYILPLLPALAIIVGRLWARIMQNTALMHKRSFSISYYLYLSILSIILVATVVFLSLGLDYRFDIEATRINIIVIALIMASTIAFSLFFFKSKKAWGLFVTLVISSSVFFLNAIDVLPKIEPNTNKSVKSLALKIKQDLTSEDKIVNYRCFLKSLPFYLKRRTIVVERERNTVYEKTEHWRDYLLKDKEALYELLRSKDFRVFCITYTWEYELIQQEYKEGLEFLGQAGKYVLFTNKKSKRVQL